MTHRVLPQPRPPACGPRWARMSCPRQAGGTRPPACAACSPLPEVRGVAYLSAELSRVPVPRNPSLPARVSELPVRRAGLSNPRAGPFLCWGHFDACSFIRGPCGITSLLRISPLRMGSGRACGCLSRARASDCVGLERPTQYKESGILLVTAGLVSLWTLSSPVKTAE